MNIPFLLEISFFLSTSFFLVALYTVLPSFSFHIYSYLNGHLYDRNKETLLKKSIRNTIKGFRDTIEYLSTNVRNMRIELGGGDGGIGEKKKLKHEIATLYKRKSSEDTLGDAIRTPTFNLSGDKKNVNPRDLRLSELV